MQPNRAELAVLRGKRDEDTLKLWTGSFAGSDEERARAYIESLALFLGQPGSDASEPGWERYVGTLSPNTRKSYTFALTEFFEWCARKHGHIVPPHKATVFDAEQYVQWLANRRGYDGMEAEKLKDGDMGERLAIYEAVKALGVCGIRDIQAKLPTAIVQRHSGKEPGDPNRMAYFFAWLNLQLGRMVLHSVLTRAPSMADLRKVHPRAGIDLFDIDGKPLMELFQYQLPQVNGVARTTISQRVSALSSYWDILQRTQSGSTSLVPSNIWFAIKKRIGRHIADEKRQAATRQRIDPHLVPILLRTVDQAKRLPDYRDKALVYLLVFLGLRVSEVIQIRRGTPLASEQNTWPGWVDLACEPPVLVVTRKGGKKMRLPYPPIALKHLYEFRSELEKAGPAAGAQSSNPDMDFYLPPTHPAWHYRDLALMPDAPLFPPLWFWGQNSSRSHSAMRPNIHNDRGPFDHRHALTRGGVHALLQRLAAKAFIVQEDGTQVGLTADQKRQFHAHALRHFALTAMAKGKKDLREVQAIAGHSSVTTTEQYLEDVEEVVALSGQTEVLQYLSQFAPVEVCAAPPPAAAEETEREVFPKAPPKAAPREPYTRKIIETTGAPAPARQPAAAKAPKPAKPAKEPVVPGFRPVEGPTVMMAAERPRIQPREISSAVESIYLAPESALPMNLTPVAPMVDEPPVRVIKTGAGTAVEKEDTIVGLDGKAPPEGRQEPGDVQLLGDQSAGTPDAVYAAMQDTQLAFSHIEEARKTNDFVAEKEAEKAAVRSGRELVASSRQWEQKDDRKGKVIDVQVHERKHSDGSKDKVKVYMVQRNEWLLENYDPFPPNYGIGTKSLLPWFVRTNADKFGYVRLGDLAEVPPIPVLSPDQANPETAGGSELLDFVELTYDSWLNGDPDSGIPPSPSRTFGLLRWFGFFAYTAWKLQTYLESNGTGVTWQPYNSVCTLGKHLRQHRADWIEGWLRANAHTYTATRRAFEKMVPRGKGQKDDTLFAEAFERAAYEGMSTAADIPSWFTKDDPIADLDPVEYDSFANWLANVTGQKLTKARKTERKRQQALAGKSQEINEDTLRGLLDLYFDSVDAAEKMKKRGQTNDPTLDEHKENAKLLLAQLVQSGLPSPTDSEYRSISNRDARKNALVEAWKKANPEAELSEINLFKGSAFFDPEAFRIDRSRHTISHTAEFKKEFKLQYGRDSELVMRRAARAMWETHKSLKPDVMQQSSAEHYSYLYSVVLCYMAWIVPSGDEMEQRMRDAGHASMPAGSARRAWLETQVDAVRDLVRPRSGEQTEYEVESERVLELMRDKGMDQASAREAVHQAMFLEQQWAEAADIAERALVGAKELSAEMTVSAPDEAKRQLDEWKAREAEVMGAMPERKPLKRKKGKEPEVAGPTKTVLMGAGPTGTVQLAPGVVRRTKKLKANSSLSVYSMPGENVTHLHRLSYEPNGEHQVYVSPGVIQRTNRMFANARQALPSPFAMMRAISLR